MPIKKRSKEIELIGQAAFNLFVSLTLRLSVPKN